MYNRGINNKQGDKGMKLIMLLTEWQKTKSVALANEICTYLVELYKIDNIKHNEIITHEQKMEMQRGEVEE